MLERGVEFDKYIYIFVLKVCVGNLDFKEGVKVYNDIIRRNLKLDVFIFIGLVDMYCKMG